MSILCKTLKEDAIAVATDAFLASSLAAYSKHASLPSLRHCCISNFNDDDDDGAQFLTSRRCSFARPPARPSGWRP